MAAWGERRGVPRSNGNEARRTSKFEQLFSDHLLSNRATTRGKNDVGPSDGTKHARTMSLHAFRAVACVASLRPFSRVSSSFVPCGEGFAPEGFQGDGSRTSKKTSTGADKECAKTVVLADVGHGIGRALLAALLEYPDCRLTVAAATPSADLVQSLRNQHWNECDALQCSVEQVDLGDDADVARWRDKITFTHGTPDIVIANVGCMPTKWVIDYGESLSSEGSTREYKYAAWTTKPSDWSRMLNDVKGVACVARQFLPSMVEDALHDMQSQQFDASMYPKHEVIEKASGEVSDITIEQSPFKVRLATRKFVTVSHVIEPPTCEFLAPYQCSYAALAAVTRTIAYDLTHALDVSDTKKSDKRPNTSSVSRKTRKKQKSNPFVGGGVVAIQIDPGALPGLALEGDGADLGPLHKTHGDERAKDWAHACVPFLLGVTREVTGEVLHVPGFR